jgi:hypothetical protein
MLTSFPQTLLLAPVVTPPTRKTFKQHRSKNKPPGFEVSKEGTKFHLGLKQALFVQKMHLASGIWRLAILFSVRLLVIHLVSTK